MPSREYHEDGLLEMSNEEFSAVAFYIEMPSEEYPGV
jgi:hypothetical protein